MKFQGGLPRVPGSSAVDYREDFFGRPSYLTVSGQLQVRAGCWLRLRLLIGSNLGLSLSPTP